MSSIEADLGEMRLFLEEICGELCRLHHVARDGLAAEAITVRREVSLGRPGAFADLHVAPEGAAPYFVEITRNVGRIKACDPDNPS